MTSHLIPTGLPATPPACDVVDHVETLGMELAELHWQLDATAAIADLMARIAASDSIEDARLVVVNCLREYLAADIVALGIPRPSSVSVRVNAVSDVASVDHSARWTDAISAAMSESIVRYHHTGEPITIAGAKSNSESAKRALMQLAHERLLETTGASFLWSCPLVNAGDEVVAVWTAVYHRRPDHVPRLIRFAESSNTSLAASLDVAVRADESVIPRSLRSLKKVSRSSRRKSIAIVLVLMGIIAALPIPHRVACPSVFEPTSQRFAVAPHDGILDETFVRSGDPVRAGQVLAQMDATDLRLQIADLAAQKERAEKKTDIHRAEGDAAATQLAHLEATELSAQLNRLRFMSDNRRIISGIDGIVLHCEVEQARGVPVRTGDVLMQVAPLKILRAELEIAPEDLAHVQPGMNVRLIADGNPLDPVSGRIDKILPISAVRNGRNVFLAEVVVDNRDGRLRPGMAARAKVDAGRRALAWIVFHHAVEKVYGLLR